ncbi:MAG: 16S rRNA (cytidine(1402)-2'-O)-methyltransferase [Deltaproteobacteria bacterium]|nr:16S rRNA (cytidine(1402)-2'-O)-methyltransferase [Deltaproteobacteria bacterium]
MNKAADTRSTTEFPGRLYVVGTPIGNPGDISLRALETFGKVDLIAAEDTRNTRRLLAGHGIDRPLISLHEHNEDRRTEELIAKLSTGLSIALVSDAGTPTLSDPGYRLVTEAVAADIRVVPIPGPSAAVAALSVSGLPTDTFLFLGFPPRKPAKRIAFLQGLAEENRTLIFYESPKRLAGLLSDLSDIVGERRAVLSREMTKPFEEFIRGTLSDIHGAIQRKKALKGECTLLVEGKKKSEDVSQKALREIVVGEFDAGETGVSALSKKIAERYGISKKKVYEEVIRMKKERGEAG